MGSAVDGAAVVGAGVIEPEAAEPFEAYRPGPLSRLVAWGEERLALAWLLSAVLLVALFAWGQGIEWAFGVLPIGSFDTDLAVLAPYGPYTIAFLALGIRIARRSLLTFWPATGWPERDRPAWEYRLRFGAFWPECAALAVGALGGVAALLGTPPAVLGPESGRVSVYVAYLPAFLLGYGLTAAAGLTTIRWLRLVSRIHREAGAIDVFDRVPLYSFSRLTVLAALSYLGAAYYSLTLNGAFQVNNAASLAVIAGTMIFGVAAFTVPMWGIHDRLDREKEALLRDVERRTNALVAELYSRIDAGKFDSIAVVNTSLAGLATLRERIERLPTWPWPPQLLRGFVSALLLPLVVFVLTRVISDLI